MQIKGNPSAAINSEPEKSLQALPAVTFRPESAADEILLFNLYAETRAEEIASFGWDTATRDAFLRMQFKAQRQGYRSMFPQAICMIILASGEPIGRMVVNHTESEIRLVDIVLLAPYRGRGIGTRLLLDLRTQAAAKRKPLRLHVVKNSRAGRLYARLGFARTDDTGVYEELEWQPEK
jgi:GNAT superfamily N-acetyltransferase